MRVGSAMAPGNAIRAALARDDPARFVARDIRGVTIVVIERVRETHLGFDTAQRRAIVIGVCDFKIDVAGHMHREPKKTPDGPNLGGSTTGAFAALIADSLHFVLYEPHVRTVRGIYAPMSSHRCRVSRALHSAPSMRGAICRLILTAPSAASKKFRRSDLTSVKPREAAASIEVPSAVARHSRSGNPIHAEQCARTSLSPCAGIRTLPVRPTGA